MHPAILFARGEELPAFMNRLRFRQSTKANCDKGFIVIAPHLVDGARAGIGKQIIVGILQAVELLDEKRVCVGPLYARDVVLPRIALDVHPFHVSFAICLHNAGADG